MEQNNNRFFVLLTPDEMSNADRLTIEDGLFSGFQLMQRAGNAVAEVIFTDYPAVQHVAVLCGPGNNGGDGYVAAEILRQSGLDVVCYASAPPKKGSGAEQAKAEWRGQTESLEAFDIENSDLIIDALFGAGLDRPLDTVFTTLIDKVNQSARPVIAVDLPSGISGLTGVVMGGAFRADVTVTFFRHKPGHFLYPGRALCGKLVLADIGINAKTLEVISPKTALNLPDLWLGAWPQQDIFQHKYSRGHVAVFSGPPNMTGAGRLAARAALRIGAGAVTLLSPEEALNVNAAHMTAIMLHAVNDKHEMAAFMQARKVRAAVLGPGFGDMKKAADYATALLEEGQLNGLVLDADGLTAFQGKEEMLAKLAEQSQTPLVMTPHEGEFARVFATFAADHALSRIEKAQQAARYSHSIIVYKGADTIIAAPDGRTVINANGTPLLATAGSGDVLSGMIAGLIAQNMPAFEAACAAVWLHAEAANVFGPGLIAEDLPEVLPKVLSWIAGKVKNAIISAS